MAYCKHCQCGHVIIFEQLGGAPLRCPKCTRFTAFLPEEKYQEPEAEKEKCEETPQLIQEAPSDASEQKETPDEEILPVTEPPVQEDTPEPKKRSFLITLESPDGGMSIPVREKIVVGRNAMGKEYLGDFPDVTREHLTIAPRANGITATLTDNGRLGTYVNGVRMIKGTSVVVSNYSEIRLASRAILLVRVKEVEEDA